MSRYSVGDQIRMLELLTTGNCSKEETAEKIGFSTQSLYYNLEKLQPRNGGNGYFGRKKHVRRTKLSAQDEMEVVDYVTEHPFSSNSDVISKLNLPVCSNTITNILERNGIGCYVALSKPFINLRNINLRLKFVNEYITWKNNNWQNVIFTDESTFYSSFSTRIFVKRPKGERDNQKYILEQEKQNVFKLNILAVMIYGQPVKVFKFNNNMSTQDHLDIAIKDVLPYIKSITNGPMHYQQDNSSVHNLLVDYLTVNKKKLNLKLMLWPAKSADLSPIENIFGISKRKIAFKLKSKTLSNQMEFDNLVVQTVESVSIDVVNKLYDSMVDRMRLVKEKKGKAINY